jgi:hypothetical protein
MAMVIQRKLFVTDKDGVEHEIKTKADLQAIFDEMTPQEYEDWKTRYRFAPIQNGTGIKDYVGTSRDLM